MSRILDTGEEGQHHKATARSIYDAGGGEIFWKSLLAGLSMGIGRGLASLLFFGLLLTIFLRYMEPVLDNYFPWLDSFDAIMQQAEQDISVTSTTPTPTATTTPVGE